MYAESVVQLVVWSFPVNNRECRLILGPGLLLHLVVFRVSIESCLRRLRAVHEAGFIRFVLKFVRNRARRVASIFPFQQYRNKINSKKFLQSYTITTPCRGTQQRNGSPPQLARNSLRTLSLAWTGTTLRMYPSSRTISTIKFGRMSTTV